MNERCVISRNNGECGDVRRGSRKPVELCNIHSLRVLEETDSTLFLLKRLDHGMQQDTIEATISETDVILMMFAEGVHESLCLPPELRHGLFRTW